MKGNCELSIWYEHNTGCACCTRTFRGACEEYNSCTIFAWLSDTDPGFDFDLTFKVISRSSEFFSMGLLWRQIWNLWIILHSDMTLSDSSFEHRGLIQIQIAKSSLPLERWNISRKVLGTAPLRRQRLVSLHLALFLFCYSFTFATTCINNYTHT